METELSELLPYLAGFLLSALFVYAPRLNLWFTGLPSAKKALLQLGLLLLVALVYFGLGCTSLAGKLGIALPCTVDGGITLIGAFIKAVLANQATYLITAPQRDANKRTIRNAVIKTLEAKR